MAKGEHDERSGEASGLYRIGAVARLIGLSTHTLRKWEDRYGFPAPLRSEGGDRLYTPQDLERLRTVKLLVDSGMSVSEVVRMSAAELAGARESLGVAWRHPVGPGQARALLSVAVLGGPLAARLSAPELQRVGLERVASGDTPEALADTLDGTSVDVLVAECPGVHPLYDEEIAQAVGRVGAMAAVVVYGFGRREDIEALRQRNVALIRSPADLSDLARAAFAVVEESRSREGSLSHPWTSPAPRRLSEEHLRRASLDSPAIKCECPRHLADLLTGLNAFEKYSASCESLNPRDAALHGYLRSTTARARAMFETALLAVAAAENLDLGLEEDERGPEQG